MKVYVGAKYSERARAKRLMNQLESQGHRITCDWTQHTNEDAKSLASYATADVKGVQNCNVAIFIMEQPHKYKGCWVEVGVALGRGKKVIIIGTAGSSCIFTNHPNITQIMGGMEQFLGRTLKEWLARHIKKSYYYKPTESLPFSDIEPLTTAVAVPFTTIEPGKTVNCQIKADSSFTSKCCHAGVNIDGDDVEGTHYWTCAKCGKPCDLESQLKEMAENGK